MLHFQLFTSERSPPHLRPISLHPILLPLLLPHVFSLSLPLPLRSSPISLFPLSSPPREPSSFSSREHLLFTSLHPSPASTTPLYTRPRSIHAIPSPRSSCSRVHACLFCDTPSFFDAHVHVVCVCNYVRF